MRYWTARLCKEAGLPKVAPQGLRGTHATASMRANTNPHQVAAEAAVTTLLSKTGSKILDRAPRRPNQPRPMPLNRMIFGVRGGGLEPPWLLTASTSRLELRRKQ